MRFIIMHKTNRHWEAGARPTPELIARVGALLGRLAADGVLLGAEGLRPSAQGVRLRFADGSYTMSRGPFEGDNELTAGFSILRVASIDDAISWASRLAAVLGDVELDIRPVTEPWDIGMAAPPSALTTRRYMVLRKATAASESGSPVSDKDRAAIAALIQQTSRTGVHLASESMRPSAAGRRYKQSSAGLSVTDGPFTESKELVAGYAVVAADSIDDAAGWVIRYIDAVGAEEVDLLELEEAGGGK